MAKKDLEKQVEEDLEAYLTTGFNNLLDGIMQKLGKEGASEEEVASPVWTGFFASSWKVSNTPPRAVDQLKSPWLEIRSAKVKDPGNGEYLIKPRFYPFNRTFKYDKMTYIGNTAAYAIWALEKGTIQTFIQGPELGKLIKDNFNEKKMRIALATKPKEGAFGTTAGKLYVGYEDLGS